MLLLFVFDEVRQVDMEYMHACVDVNVARSCCGSIVTTVAF